MSGFRDGPLSSRRREEFTYGTGKSVLGRILVASSGEGVVAILWAKGNSDLVGELRRRFPKVDLVHDQPGTRVAVAKILKFIEDPASRLAAPLDIRGTALQKRIYEEVRRVPLGGTSTYSKLAELVGVPKAIRAVASTCARNNLVFAVPCHRVLHKDGSGYGGARQNKLLAYEAKAAARPASSR